MGELKPSENGRVFMFDNDGVPRFVDDTKLVGKKVAEFNPVCGEKLAELVRSDSSTISFIGADGYVHIANVVRVPGPGWNPASEIDTREFDRNLRSTIFSTAGISLLLIVLGSVLGVVFARSIPAPSGSSGLVRSGGCGTIRRSQGDA